MDRKQIIKQEGEKTHMARKCKYCGGKDVRLNPERLWVCADCGTVQRPLLVRPMIKAAMPIQRPQER
jgi:ribosomal protein L37AE/L43A